MHQKECWLLCKRYDHIVQSLSIRQCTVAADLSYDNPTHRDNILVCCPLGQARTTYDGGQHCRIIDNHKTVAWNFKPALLKLLKPGIMIRECSMQNRERGSQPPTILSVQLSVSRLPVYASIFVGKLHPDLVVWVGILFHKGESLGHVAEHGPPRRPWHRAVRSNTLCTDTSPFSV